MRNMMIFLNENCEARGGIAMAMVTNGEQFAAKKAHVSAKTYLGIGSSTDLS